MEISKKILVVDDDHIIRTIVSQMLSRLGYDVWSAADAREGLGIFLQNRFDIVLSDFEMPGMDGVDLAHSIKQRSPSTPVVIMTGARTENIFSRSSTAVDVVVSKPFTMAELNETIRTVSGNALHA